MAPWSTFRLSGDDRQWLLADHSGTNTHFWLFLCGIRFRFRVRVRLKTHLKGLTLDEFVREWLANSHLRDNHSFQCLPCTIITLQLFSIPTVICKIVLNSTSRK